MHIHATKRINKKSHLSDNFCEQHFTINIHILYDFTFVQL